MDDKKVELVVESIVTENPKTFDNRIKLFYDTYADVKVIGYSHKHITEKYQLFVVTLMGTKIS